MTSLSNKINSFNFSTQLVEINDLITNGVTAGLNRWGTPAIEIAGYSDSVTLDSIAQQLLKAGKERCEADDLSLAERIAAVNLIEKIKICYNETDNAQSEDKNSIKERIKNWFIEASPFTPSRMLVEEFGEIPFLVYSEEKFLNEFGGEFTDFDDDFIPNFRTHPNSNGEYSEGKTIARFDSVLQKFEDMTKYRQSQGLVIQEFSKPLLLGSPNPLFFPVTFSPLTFSAKLEESSPIVPIKEEAVACVTAKEIKPHVEAKAVIEAETNVPAVETVKSSAQVKTKEAKIYEVNKPKSIFRNMFENLLLNIIVTLGLILGFVYLQTQNFKKKNSSNKPNNASVPKTY